MCFGARELARQAHAAWGGGHPTSHQGEAVVGTVPQLQAACVVEGGGCGGVAHRVDRACHHQVVAMRAGRQHRGAQIAFEGDGLPRLGVVQHHAGACGHRTAEGGALALSQGQCFQGHESTHRAIHTHHTSAAGVEHDGFRIHRTAVDCFVEGDVGACHRCIGVASGVKRGGVRGVGRHHHIVHEPDRRRTLGAY